MSKTLSINIALDFTTEGKMTADVHATLDGKTKNILTKQTTWDEFHEGDFLKQLNMIIANKLEENFKGVRAFGT